MHNQGEEIDATNALVMIARAPTQPVVDAPAQPPIPPVAGDIEETEGVSNPLTMDMSAAIPPKKNTKRAQVKTRDWRSSIQAYNEL